MKKMLNDFAYSALFAAALGVVLLIWPSLSGKIICYGLAAVLLALGVYRIICYFVRDAMMTMLRGDLMAGLVLIALGIFVIAKPDVIVSVLPVLFGLLLILGAMSEIQTAFDMKRMESSRWYLSLIAALVLAALGAVILLNPFSTALTLMRFIGVALIVEGVSEFIFSIRLAHRQKTYYPVEGKVVE